MMYAIQTTGQINGWGSDPFKSVTRLPPGVRAVLREGVGDVIFFIPYTPYHYTQSGVKVLRFYIRSNKYYYSHREPHGDEELRAIRNRVLRHHLPTLRGKCPALDAYIAKEFKGE